MNHEYYPRTVDVDVEMGNWSTANRDQVIGTFALGPCVGLALHDTKSEMGFIGHTMGGEIRTLEDLVSEVMNQGVLPQNLRAWFSGGEIFEWNGDLGYEEIREDAVALLEGIGMTKDHITESWVDTQDGSADMILVCSTGICVIEHHFDDPFDFEDD